METPYKKAWSEFSQSKEFFIQLGLWKRAEPATRDGYLINRIREVFDAGWNAAQSVYEVEKDS